MKGITICTDALDYQQCKFQLSDFFAAIAGPVLHQKEK